MVKVNGVDVPTCAELSRLLQSFGDVPLYSGYGWYVINGFAIADDGIQTTARQCPPPGVSPKQTRKAVM